MIVGCSAEESSEQSWPTWNVDLAYTELPYYVLESRAYNDCSFKKYISKGKLFHIWTAWTKNDILLSVNLLHLGQMIRDQCPPFLDFSRQ